MTHPTPCDAHETASFARPQRHLTAAWVAGLFRISSIGWMPLGALCLHLVLELGISPPSVARHLQRLAAAVDEWPHFAPPPGRRGLTACDVALCDSVEEHIDIVRAWAGSLWSAWAPHHAAVAGLVERHIGMS